METQIESVLSQLVRDEAIIVRLIKQDILYSVLLDKIDLDDQKNFVIQNELDHLVAELMFFETAKNPVDLVKFYKKYVSDSVVMVEIVPSVSVSDLALNGYLELKKLKKWF